MDDTASVAYLKKVAPKPITIIPSKFIPKAYLGMIVQRGNTQLERALLAAMQRLHANGTYSAVLAKWQITTLASQRPSDCSEPKASDTQCGLCCRTALHPAWLGPGAVMRRCQIVVGRGTAAR